MAHTLQNECDVCLMNCKDLLRMKHWYRQPPSIQNPCPKSIKWGLETLKIFQSTELLQKKTYAFPARIYVWNHTSVFGVTNHFLKNKNLLLCLERHVVSISPTLRHMTLINGKTVDLLWNIQPNVFDGKSWEFLQYLQKKDTSTGQPLPFISILNLHRCCWWKTIRLTTVWMVPKTL